MTDEAAVIRAVDNTVTWLLQKGWRNLLLEIDNERNIPAYEHAVLKADRVHELIHGAKATEKDGCRLLVGTSDYSEAIPGKCEADFGFPPHTPQQGCRPCADRRVDDGHAKDAQLSN